MIKVLVDTSVWSLALRRARPVDHPAVELLRELVVGGEAGIIGPIRQEILSGIRDASQYGRLRTSLRAFPDLGLHESDYEHAAQVCNACRAQGVQGSGTDFLICAVARRRKLAILTIDRDFARFAEVVPLTLIG